MMRLLVGRKSAVMEPPLDMRTREKNDIIRTCGGYFFSNSWNSDAHSPQGYSLEVR